MNIDYTEYESSIMNIVSDDIDELNYDECIYNFGHHLRSKDMLGRRVDDDVLEEECANYMHNHISKLINYYNKHNDTSVEMPDIDDKNLVKLYLDDVIPYFPCDRHECPEDTDEEFKSYLHEWIIDYVKFVIKYAEKVA